MLELARRRALLRGTPPGNPSGAQPVDRAFVTIDHFLGMEQLHDARIDRRSGPSVEARRDGGSPAKLRTIAVRQQSVLDRLDARCGHPAADRPLDRERTVREVDAKRQRRLHQRHGCVHIAGRDLRGETSAERLLDSRQGAIRELAGSAGGPRQFGVDVAAACSGLDGDEGRIPVAARGRGVRLPVRRFGLARLAVRRPRPRPRPWVQFGPALSDGCPSAGATPR